MKRIKYLIMIVFALVLCGSVFAACGSKLAEDHSSLLKEGYIYRVKYESDGGDFSSARNVSMYFKTDGIKTADPESEVFMPTKSEQFVRYWYRKDNVNTNAATGVETYDEVVWSFSKDRIDKSFMEKKYDSKAKKNYYELVLYPKWEYYLYIDYCISYVELDKTTYKGTLTNNGVQSYPNANDEGEENVSPVTNDFKKQEEMLNYRGKTVTHTSGTAVPEDFDILKHSNIKSAQDIMPMFYADPELTERVTFPLDSTLVPKPLDGQNRRKIYVKFFDVRYTVLSTAADLSAFLDTNYYLWRDIDFQTENSDNTVGKKVIKAADKMENKVFLGNGFTISNLSVECDQASFSSEYMGMFGTINNSKVSNVTFRNCVVTYNMTDVSRSGKLGLLSGLISGSESSVTDVHFEDTLGYVRNGKSNEVYGVSYHQSNNYIYNTKLNVPESEIAVTADSLTNIKYLNLHVSTPDTFSDTGFSVWEGHDVARADMYVEVGNFDQVLKHREAGDNGRESGYYTTLKIRLTEIEGVQISILQPIDEDGTRHFEDAASLGFQKQSDGSYLLTKYVPENIKAGRIVAKWNEEIVDEYKFLVRGGSGNLTTANSLKLPTGESVSLSYDNYDQILTYSSDYELKYYTPASETDTRPLGYSIPVRLRSYVNPIAVEATGSTPATYNIAISIDGVQQDLSKITFNKNISTTNSFYYTELWIPVTKENPNTDIVVNFYNRYELTFSVKADKDIKFAAPAAPAQQSFTSSVELPVMQPIAVDKQGLTIR